MIQAFFDNLEDSERPLLGPNIWLLKKIGAILPVNNVTNKILYIMLHEFLTLFTISQFVELYYIRSDVDLVITNLRLSIASFICVAKANSFVIWQTSWRELIDYVTETDKSERENPNPVVSPIVNSYTRYSRRLVKYYWILLLTTSFCVALNPIVRYLSSSTYREAIHNGTEPFPHMFVSWVPFDKYSFPGNFLTVCIHMTACVYGSILMAAYDSVVVVLFIFIDGKLKLLRRKCSQMFANYSLGVSDEEVKITLQDLHAMHILLFKYTKLFNFLLSPIMFLYVIMCSAMLCACIFQLTIVTSAVQKFLIMHYFVFATAPIFMFCWFSTNVLDQSEQVTQGPYESEWWAVDMKQRKNVLILTGQLSIFPIFTAGPFNYLRLTTFVAIMKGAYSYYTIFRTNS